MNKRFVFFYALVSTTLMLLILFTVNYLDKIKKINKEEKLKEEIKNIKKYIQDNKIKEVIRVKITETGKIEEMTINEYLTGVLPAEMPPEYGLEALKAQAVAARTYLYQKISSTSHKDADICDNYAHCQAYLSQEKILKSWKNSKKWDDLTCKNHFKKVQDAVFSTENIVATYKGKYIRAYFHACSGGKTENVSNIWGKQNIPYLVSVESKGEESYKNYTSKVKLTAIELQQKLNKEENIKCNIADKGGDIVRILSYTDTGRVDKVEIGGVVYSAEELRSKLGLRSTNFKVEYKGNEIIFNVIGNGHGVGMSQVGAACLAEQGYTFDKIIEHYYTGVDITYVNKEETNENKI